MKGYLIAPGPTKIFGLLFYSALAIFILNILIEADFTKLLEVKYNLYYLGLSILFAFSFRFLGVLIWRFILISLGCTGLPGLAELSQVYSKAWMGRYIPGKVAWIAAKVVFGTRYGISGDKLATGSVLEALLQITTTLLFSVLIILVDSRLSLPSAQSISVAMTLVGMTLVLSPPVFSRLRLAAYRVLGRTPDTEIQLTTKLMIHSSFMYGCGFILSGLSYFFLINSFYPLSLDNTLYIIAVVNLAGVAGMIALFAPAGLGVREGVLLLLLPVVLPEEIALIAMVASRLFSIVSDIIFVALCHISTSKRIRKAEY